MKFKTIRSRMLFFILPILICSMAFLTLSSVNSSEKIIKEQIEKEMESKLQSNSETIAKNFSDIKALASNISYMVAATYKTTSLKEYEAMLGDIIYSNDLVLGSGIWFEPYLYDPAEKYIGPYIYKEGNEAVTTYDYSNAEYDYFGYEWYQNATKGEGAVITEPYYDETLDVIMSSCTAPLMTEDGTFLGAVTVDIELTTIEEIVTAISVGKSGKAFLLTADGLYLSCQDKDKVMKENITDSLNATLAVAGTKILSENRGETTYTNDGKEYNIYFTVIPELGWPLCIEISNSELLEPVHSLTVKLIVIAAIAVSITILVVMYQIIKLSGNLMRVQAFAADLSEGNFSVDYLKVTTEDELGQMSRSLNDMYNDNKGVIMTMASHAKTLNESSVEFKNSSDELFNKFGNIVKIMQGINSDMMTASASTEEVNASVEEVNSSVSLLSAETEKSAQLAETIKDRALNIEKTSQSSYDQANELTAKFEKNIADSIENVKIVDSIGVLAEVISEIAEQINLLSLNASIEAARAGEHGKGFAVVAGEIGKLAGNTSEAVSKIKVTIDKIEDAITNLTDNSKQLLGFVTDTVTPDYDKFVGVAKQYGEDAKKIEELSRHLSEMTESIESIIGEVKDAIGCIAESSQQTAESGKAIMDTVNDVSSVVDHLADRSVEQMNIAGELKTVVDKFKF